MIASPARLRLAELEQVIEKGFKAWVEVSKALIEIRDNRLFLEGGFSSFEKYCKAKYDKGPSWAWKMIQAGEVQKTINEPLPSVSAALQLRKSSPPRRKTIIAGIKEKCGKVTAESIQSASKPKPEPRKQVPTAETVPIVEDGTGLEVPKEAMGIWNRQDEVKDILNQLSAIKSTISRYAESGDRLFFEVDFQEVLADLSRTYTNLKLALPFAVCPYCNGVMDDKDCKCGGRKVLSQFYYETFVPTEMKALRES